MNIEYRDSAACKTANLTYHLASLAEWTSQSDGDGYLPSAFAGDGFIHCTNGLDLLTDVANLFYKSSPDPRIVLVLDVARITSPVQYDDPDQTFPHIYGPLNTSAVIGVLSVARDNDGTFVQLGGNEISPQD